MKVVAILQSNYIPWRGYFDLIAAADEFILYDEVQYTKNDWRNRNVIKTPQGLKWISVPAGRDIKRRICEVRLTPEWQIKHWKTLQCNYRRAPYFDEVAEWLRPFYVDDSYQFLSTMNRKFIVAICKYIGIKTRISSSWEYDSLQNTTPTSRLLAICQQAEATHYLSGPSARGYIDASAFSGAGIAIKWFDYVGLSSYPQLWGDFASKVTILDLLFNCGREAHLYMRHVEK